MDGKSNTQPTWLGCCHTNRGAVRTALGLSEANNSNRFHELRLKGRRRKGAILFLADSRFGVRLSDISAAIRPILLGEIHLSFHSGHWTHSAVKAKSVQTTREGETLESHYRW
jgi:hypothetical protein